MKHLRAINKKARRVDNYVASLGEDVVGLQNNQNPTPQQRPHVPMGCALAFSPGWEVDSAGGTAGCLGNVCPPRLDVPPIMFDALRVTSSQDHSGTRVGVPRESKDGERRVALVPKMVEKLTGRGDLYRVRVGDHRVVYSIDDDGRVVVVEDVRGRDDIYRKSL